MSRALLILRTAADRAKASNWIAKAPAGARVEFKAPKRSLPQNARMWAMLTEIAEQVTWHGMKLSADDWKLVFMDALNREIRMVPNLDGNGFVNLGRSSSDLTVPEMSDLMELIAAFGANHDVIFSDSGVAASHAHTPDTAGDGFPSSRPSPATQSERMKA